MAARDGPAGPEFTTTKRAARATSAWAARVVGEPPELQDHVGRVGSGERLVHQEMRRRTQRERGPPCLGHGLGDQRPAGGAGEPLHRRRRIVRRGSI